MAGKSEGKFENFQSEWNVQRFKLWIYFSKFRSADYSQENYYFILFPLVPTVLLLVSYIYDANRIDHAACHMQHISYYMLHWDLIKDLKFEPVPALWNWAYLVWQSEFPNRQFQNFDSFNLSSLVQIRSTFKKPFKLISLML